MGRLAVPLEVGKQAGDRYETVEALVDTGTKYTVLPGSVLRDLGVSPDRTSVFELSDASRHEWQMGRTWVRLRGKLEMTPVVLGEDDVSPRLGVVTLEEFLLAPDTIRKTLIPVAGLLMTLRQARLGLNDPWVRRL